ncbi:MAG: hypothetical protein J5719_06085 [Bacteroidales bacterium]|nr:hypothetical protein [Bacteroidales bacterium]
MRRYLSVAALLLIVLLIGTSCSRKIVGARPHRRDRNCGCEWLAPAADTTACTHTASVASL